MLVEIIIVCLAVLTVASLVTVGWVVSQTVTLAWKVHEQSCIVSRSQQEAATKYVTATAQTANLLSEKIDARVASRVKTINAIVRGSSAEEEVEAIEDPPQPPDIYQSGMVNDMSEIERELRRIRRDDGFSVREMGVGVEEV